MQVTSSLSGEDISGTLNRPIGLNATDGSATDAGDRIILKLVNKAPSADIKKFPWDKETSGVYLIEEVTHTYEKNEGTNGRFRTTVRVMRDSYGMPDEISSHGN